METNNNYKASSENDINNCDNKNLIELRKDNDDKYVNLKKLVRSRFILNKIFSFLDKKKKLIMIKYNKLYINFLGITIEQFQKESGRIKIDGINGYGKEYELEKMDLIFKGFYLNGKKNGKGEEFLNNKLIFKGEYLNGKRNGKGKEYYYKRDIRLENEYFKDKIM